MNLAYLETYVVGQECGTLADIYEEKARASGGKIRDRSSGTGVVLESLLTCFSRRGSSPRVSIILCTIEKDLLIKTSRYSRIRETLIHHILFYLFPVDLFISFSKLLTPNQSIYRYIYILYSPFLNGTLTSLFLLGGQAKTPCAGGLLAYRRVLESPSQHVLQLRELVMPLALNPDSVVSC